MNTERLQLTLPSGGHCTIRKVSPLIVAEAHKAANDIECARVFVTRCTGKIALPTTAGGKLTILKLVNKDFDECITGQLPLDDLDAEDFAFLQGEILDFSGLNQDDGEEAGPADASTKSKAADGPATPNAPD